MMVLLAIIATSMPEIIGKPIIVGQLKNAQRSLIKNIWREALHSQFVT